jgi:regulatory helix-turn-helix LysR family protein
MNGKSESRNTSLRGRASTVDLQQRRYAIAAADHGSFRRAAEALLVWQSTLSRCIRQLENSIRMIVFGRSSGGGRGDAGRLREVMRCGVLSLAYEMYTTRDRLTP